MLRFWVALLCLILAAPVIAQKGAGPADNAAAALSMEKARADKAERDLAIREAADQLEDAQTAQAYNRFEIMIGLFSALIAVLVIVFGFRTEKTAAVAARQEVANAKGQIDDLLTEARKATAAALSAQTQAEDIKAEVDQLRQESVDAVAQAKAGAEETTRHAEAAREAAAIIDSMKAKADTGGETPKLTAEQEQKVEAAAKGIEDKPEADWSIEEFKTRIGKARFIDSDWTEMLRLAQQMAIVHGKDDDAFVFAKNAEGDALIKLLQFELAVIAYDRVIDRYARASKPELEKQQTWAMYHKGVCLNQTGNSSEAEKLFGKFLPLQEKVKGARHPNILAIRHELARSILDQGRAAEAEGIFRALLPLREKTNGAEHSGTLVTRHALARSILDQGRAAEAAGLFRALLPLREQTSGAEHSDTLVPRYWCAAATLQNGDAPAAQALLDPIPHEPDGSEWNEMMSANLAFIRGKVADALAKRADADKWLKKAAKHYAAVYPPDHYYRRQFDAYIAARPATKRTRRSSKSARLDQ